MSDTKRRPCSALFKSPSIRWDGEMTVCCFDPSMEISLGNIAEHGFKALWYGKKADEMRMMHIMGDFHLIETPAGYKKCLHCPGYDTPTISDREIEIFKEYYEKTYGSYSKKNK